MRINRIIGSLLLFVIATVGYGQGLANLKLSEVFVSGSTSLQNEDGEHVAWVEIANVSWSSTNIGGCYLTNDRAVLDKSLSSPQRIALMSQIPNGDERTNLAPKGQVVFFTDSAKNLGTLHVKFKLTPGQENFIALYEANGNKLIDSVTVPATLSEGQSYARFWDNDGKSSWRTVDSSEVTPNANNGLESKMDKSSEWKEKDPHGIAMTILSMGIVMTGLLLLFIFFLLFGRLFRMLAKKSKEKEPEVARGVATAAVAPAKMVNETPVANNPEVDQNAVVAAIAMALFEEFDAHDEERSAITIIPMASNWVQRGVEMAKRSLH